MTSVSNGTDVQCMKEVDHDVVCMLSLPPSNSHIFTPRDGLCSAVVGDIVYVFGGTAKHDNDVYDTDDLLLYTPGNGKWKKLAVSNDSRPPARTAACMAAVGSTLYLFGGINSVYGWLNDLWSFNTETNEWTEITSKGAPSPRDKASCAVIGARIWFFGGFGPQDSDKEEDTEESVDDDLEDVSYQNPQQFGWFDSLYCFDTNSSIWHQPMQKNLMKPTARAAHAMTSWGNCLIIFGGRDCASRRNDLHMFDTASMLWMHFPVHGPLPEARSFHSLTCVGNRRFVLVGGRNVSNDTLDDIWILDSDSQIWLRPSLIFADGTSKNPSWLARCLHSAVVVGKDILVFGGGSNCSPDTGENVVRYNQIFSISCDSILKGGPKEELVKNKSSVSPNKRMNESEITESSKKRLSLDPPVGQ